VPFPYARLIVGKRQYRFLTVGNVNSDATRFVLKSPEIRTRQCRFPTRINRRETALPYPTYHQECYQNRYD